jgi:hypothetical protein
MTPYYPEYQPKDPDKFAAMLKLLGTAQSAEQLGQLTLLYTFDMTYPREDIMVALTRIEHERGWKVV